MRRTKMMAAMILGCLLSLGFAAAPALAEVKVGFINTGGIFDGSEMGKRLTNELKSKDAELNKQAEEANKMYADLSKQKGVIKDEVFREKDLEIQKRFKELQAKASELGNEVALKRQEFLEAVREVTREIGEKEKYTVVMDTLPLPYFEQSKDITAKVIKEMNRRYK